MKEAPSFEGASLVSGTPPSGSPRGWGTGDGEAWLASPLVSPNLGPSGSSSAMWNSAWNFGLQ